MTLHALSQQSKLPTVRAQETPRENRLLCSAYLRAASSMRPCSMRRGLAEFEVPQLIYVSVSRTHIQIRPLAEAHDHLPRAKRHIRYQQSKGRP